MSWFSKLFTIDIAQQLRNAQSAGYASGYEEGIEAGYKKGYDATHETSEAAAASLKADAQTVLLYQMLEIVGQHYDGPITAGKVVDIIKGQGLAAGVAQGREEGAATLQAERDGANAVISDLQRKLVAASESKLLEAILALYTAAFWSPDRPCDAIALWTDVRDAAGIAPGTGPAPLTIEAKNAELDEIDTTATTIEGVVEVEAYETRLPSPGNDFGYFSVESDTVDKEVEAVKGLQEEAESWQQDPHPPSAVASQPPSTQSLEKSLDSSKPTSDSSSSSSSQQPSSSDTKSTPTTKKPLRSSKPRKPRKPLQRKKKPTRS